MSDSCNNGHAHAQVNVIKPPAAHHDDHVKQPHSTGPIVGGFSAEQPITPEYEKLVLAHQSDIAKAAGVVAFAFFQPVSQRTQVVAGINLLVKFSTGEPRHRAPAHSFIHAILYLGLDKTVQVTEVETGKSDTDPLEPFTTPPPPHGSDGAGLPGGVSAEQPITPEHEKLVLAHQSDIEKAAGGGKFMWFTPVSQREQVVAGLILLVKISTGEPRHRAPPNSFIHATLFLGLDKTVKVTKVETGKADTDPL